MISLDKKYLNIYSIIANKIDSKEYQVNEKLPSENELMSQYDVSRDTVRKSLSLLEQNGYIQKAKGKGSFVLNINKFDFPVSGVVSFKEISKKYSCKIKTFVEYLDITFPEKNIARGMEIQGTDKIWKIIRTRSFDGEKVIIDKDYILEKFVKNLTRDICEDSIYEYIENKLGLKIAYAKKEITVHNATEEDKYYLNMKDFKMVVVVRSYTYLDDTNLFQYTESRHRPDKFVFLDFARRHKN